MLLDFIALTTTKVEKEKSTRTLIAYYNFLMAKREQVLKEGLVQIFLLQKLLLEEHMKIYWISI